MRLPFEDWLQEQRLEESDVAFREAVIAHKAGAYRAALLFSFVGMGLCIRRRLLSASPPTGISDGQWGGIQKKLQSEDEWDTQVFDCTQQSRPSAIFVVEDHLREEMKYWKNRRNDCAHFKRNEIGAPHVEAFWLFLRSNLGRWVPNGSKADLLVRLADHFDPNLTPPGTPVGPLVQMIAHAMGEAELPKFLDDLAGTLTTNIGNFRFSRSHAVAVVLVDLLSTAPPQYASAAEGWVRAHQQHLVDMLRLHPQHVAVLAGYPQLVRALWRTQLFKAGLKDLEVFCALLRNSLIPNDELEEAVEWLVDELNEALPNEEQNRILASVGFWRIFDRNAFDNRGIRRFQWANRKAKLIAWRLANLPLTEQIAQAVCDTFSSDYYPFEARDAIKEMLSASTATMAELAALATTGGTSVPESLK